MPARKASIGSWPARRPSTDGDPVSAYAWDVLNDKIIAGRLVKLACQRHFDDLAEGHKRGLIWRPDMARYAIEFNSFLRHSKGEWANQRIKLEPWQEFIHGSVFGWYRTNKTRRFRTVYEEIARKNGKSTSAASVALKCLVADGEPGADIFSAATKKDQARIVFDEARRMVLKSPELLRKVRAFRLSLAVDSTMSSFQPLSSDDKTLDGLNPHAVIVDELHKHKTRAVLDVLDTALGSRRNPLLWIITTAGDDNPESVYAQEHGYAISVLEGTFKDDAWFAYIATLDPMDRWDDPACWIKANPNLGISVKLEDLERQARGARASPAKRSEFLRLRLNVRQASTTQKITAELWDRNSRGPFDPATLYGRRCFGGLDLASKVDIGAWVKLFPPTDQELFWRVVCRFWIPGGSVEEKSSRDRVQYQRWIDEGWIEPTAGDVIDHSEIQNAILEDQRQYELVSLAYDPWNATQLAVNLQGHGVPAYEFIQGLRSYNAPTKELDALIVAGLLDHGENPVLKWMALNMRVQKDKNNNEMPTKKSSTGRIDGMSALIMALGRTMVDAPSVYEERGFDTF